MLTRPVFVLVDDRSYVLPPPSSLDPTTLRGAAGQRTFNTGRWIRFRRSAIYIFPVSYCPGLSTLLTGSISYTPYHHHRHPIVSLLCALPCITPRFQLCCAGLREETAHAHAFSRIPASSTHFFSHSAFATHPPTRMQRLAEPLLPHHRRQRLFPYDLPHDIRPTTRRTHAGCTIEETER